MSALYEHGFHIVWKIQVWTIEIVGWNTGIFILTIVGGVWWDLGRSRMSADLKCGFKN